MGLRSGRRARTCGRGLCCEQFGRFRFFVFFQRRDWCDGASGGSGEGVSGGGRRTSTRRRRAPLRHPTSAGAAATHPLDRPRAKPRESHRCKRRRAARGQSCQRAQAVAALRLPTRPLASRLARWRGESEPAGVSRAAHVPRPAAPRSAASRRRAMLPKFDPRVRRRAR